MASIFRVIVDPLFVISVSVIIFYSYILYVMIRSNSRTFQSIFFRIFIFTGIFDIMTVVAEEWIRADLKLGFGHGFEPVIRVMMALTGTNTLIHMFGALLMTLNRYTATCKPQFHQEFWAEKKTNCILFAIFIVSYVAYTELFIVKFIYKPTAEGWKLIGRERETYATRMMGAIVVSVAETVNVIFIIITVFCIRSQSKRYHRRSRSEMHLIMVTIISCPANLMEALYDASFILNLDNSFVNWFRSQFDIYYFFMMTVNAYSIVILSQQLRLEIWKRWKCGEKKSINSGKNTGNIFAIQSSPSIMNPGIPSSLR